jgi:hypothetical protein
VVWEKVGVDMVYMSVSEEGLSFLVFTRDDLSGWVEGRVIAKANSLIVAKFLYEDIIYRYGYPRVIIIDNGLENQMEPLATDTKYNNQAFPQSEAETAHATRIVPLYS